MFFDTFDIKACDEMKDKTLHLILELYFTVRTNSLARDTGGKPLPLLGDLVEVKFIKGSSKM